MSRGHISKTMNPTESSLVLVLVQSFDLVGLRHKQFNLFQIIRKQCEKLKQMKAVLKISYHNM